jgi:tape measure domain-containing protein
LSTISQNNIVVNYVITSDQIAKTKTEFDKLTDAEKKAIGEAKKLNDQLKTTGQEGSRSVKGVGNEMLNLSSIAKSGAGLLAGFFAVSSIKAFADKIVETTIKFEGYSKAIEFGSGNAENFARNQEFLTNLINKYGLGLASTTEAYKSFFNASTLAGQSQQETNRQFEAVTKAGTVLKLTTDQMQGAFLALGQMMSKGTVQAEELRGQLGERIPGAFSIMAKALGVNERQLNKMLEQGQVLSKDALPKFAAELEKTFGPGAEKNLNGMVNSQNRFNNSIDELVLAIGNKLQPFLQGAYDLAAGIAKQLSGIGQGAKKETVENIALKKTESDIAKKILDVSIQQGVQIDRRRAASELLFSIDKKIDDQLTQNANSRIAKDELALKKGVQKLAILQAEEVLLTQIAGVEIKGGEKKKELTDEELKALKAQYDAKLKLLELEKRIADINIEVTTEREDERTLKLLRNAEKFGKDKLAIDREFAALGIVDAQNNAKLQTAIVKKQGNDVKVELKKQSDGFRDAEEKYDKEQLEAAKKLEEAKQKARKASMDKTVKDNKEMIDEVNKDADDLAKKEFDRIKQTEQLRQEAIQQAFDLAVFSTNAIFDIQSQYAARDFARKQKQFDEEIRLADGNIQKETEINEKRAAAEKEYRLKEFRANQVQAIANAVFAAAPYIIKYSALLPASAANLALTLFTLSAQTTAILAQPPPEFAEGTKGKPFKGRAIVGEKGTEKVVTQSGKVYYTPGVATLAQFDEPVQIIPNNQLGLNDRKQLSLIYGSTSRTNDSGGRIIEKLSNIESGLKNMPVAAISLDERGFMKKVRTPNRSTTILNNRFKN